MAIAAGVLIQIILMICFRRIETCFLRHFHGNLFVVIFLLLRNEFFNYCFVFRKSVINSRAVLDAYVRTLAVDAGGVDDSEQMFQKLFQGNDVIVVMNSHRFRMRCLSRLQIFIARVGDIAVDITGGRRLNAFQLFEISLDAPKTATRKNYSFHFFLLLFFDVDDVPQFDADAANFDFIDSGIKFLDFSFGFV